jgi:hypothetical protein
MARNGSYRMVWTLAAAGFPAILPSLRGAAAGAGLPGCQPGRSVHRRADGGHL